jgi:DmsE family decaheme c-type cytochrome
MRRLHVLFLFLISLSVRPLLLAQSNQGASSTVPTSQYVGAETCETCHEELFNGLQRTSHSKSHIRQKGGADVQACETCHGAGANHVESGGDVSKIFSFKSAAVDDINARCLSCHAREHEHSAFSESPHASAKLSCISCHSPHHAKVQKALLTDRQPALCYSCHSDQRAEFSKQFRHRVNDGLIRCADCHNVHTAASRSLRSSPEQDKVCFKCHRQLQGPFMFEHVPVKTEGCMACHQPHGSVNPRMLKVNQVNLLCLQCHTPGTTPNTKNGGVNAPGTPAAPVHDQTMKFQACTMCHVFIHGSNADETFMK